MDKQALKFIDLLALKPSIKKDSIQLFVKSSGYQQINEQAQYENVQLSIQSDKEAIQQPDQFYVEQQQQTTDTKGIKTKQFWKAIMEPSGALKPQKTPFNYELKHVFSYGFNSIGRDTIILVNGNVCRAIGCMIVLGQNIYLKHNFTITSLSLNHKTNQVLSSTEGISPQLIIWNYNKENKQLSFKKKFFLGRRTQPISMISFFKDDYVFAIQKVSIHKSSYLYLFNKNTEKKHSLKVGKCYDLEILQNQKKDDRIFIANQKGVSQLSMINQSQFELKQFIQCESITAFQPIQTNQILDIIYGDRQGKVHLHNAKKQTQVHKGWIMQIKVCEFTQKLDKNVVITLGAQDNKMIILLIKDKQIMNFRQLFMPGYVRSLFPQKNKILLGCRDGTIEQYNLINLLNLQNQKQKCLQYSSVGYQSFVSNPETKHFFQYNRHFKKFIYGKSDSKAIYFVSGIQCKKKESYILRQCPQTLSTYGNLIAYTYDIYKQIRSQQLKMSKMLNKKNKNIRQQFYKSILVIEDYVQNKLKLKADIHLKNNLQKQGLFKHCLKIKWSQDGSYLALSFYSGQLIVLNYQNLSKVQNSLNLLIKQFKQGHQEQVHQIIWSKDSKYIKSVGQSQVFYWQIQRSQSQQVKLKNIPNKIVKDIFWTQMGKYSWQNKQIWQKTSLIYDIVGMCEHDIIQTDKISNKQIQSHRQSIISCHYSNGVLGFYGCPANNKIFKQYKLFSDSNYKVIPNYVSKNQISLWILYEGILSLLKLIKKQ